MLAWSSRKEDLIATILVVDDDPSARDLLVTILGYSGHQLREASDGLEALSLIEAQIPDLIIADLLMPTMDGFEFVRRLRQNRSAAQTPVVFYTATYLESEARTLASQCGVSHIITKPAEPERIYEVVNEVLGAPQSPVSPPSFESFHESHLGLLLAKLSRKTETVVPRLDAMIELNLQFASERNPQKLLVAFCGAARKIVGARYGAVSLLDEKGESVQYPFVSGMSSEIAESIDPAPLPSGRLPDRLFSNREARRMGELSSAPETVCLPRSYPVVHSFLSVPITSPERTYGWLCLTDKVGAAEFSESDEGLAQILAAQVGRIYENGSLYSEIRNQVTRLEAEIAERKRAEETLRQSEERFRELAENIHEVFWIKDILSNRILYVSPAYEKIWGRSRESLYASPGTWLEAIHPDDAPGIMEAVMDRQSAGTYDEEYRIICPNGLVRWIHDRAFPIRDATGQVCRIAGTAEDITVRKRIEEQLRQLQKLEEIGRLAGGVAHDFNNILAVIQMQSELLKSTTNASPEQIEFADEITTTVQRGAALTRQLLLFSRREVFQPRDVDLNASIKAMVEMLRRMLTAKVHVKLKLAPEPMLIHGDPNMMDQVLMNLAVNSRDAMPNGGEVVIETKAVEIDDLAASHSVQMRTGSFVCLEVSDQGCGIPAENLPKIFEPFFTTKEIGKGTGLGLSTVFGIVRQHQGWVNVYSEVGHGTTFRVYLPRIGSALSGAASKPQLDAARGGNETILLAEDDLSLRFAVRKALSQLGYRILEAPTGVKALEVWNQNRDEIRLLITDLVMPDGMGGIELAKRIHSEDPKLKVIYVSGYSAEMASKDSPLEEGVNFLAKPFQARRLAQLVRNSLDATDKTV